LGQWPKPNLFIILAVGITPKRVTSLRCPSPRHSVKATQSHRLIPALMLKWWRAVCNAVKDCMAGPAFKLQTCSAVPYTRHERRRVTIQNNSAKNKITE